MNFKVEIVNKEIQVVFLSTSKNSENLNFSNVTVEKFKFREFLLGDKNGIYLSSKIISTLITSQVDTPRFGLLQLMETVRPVKKGEEIFSHYGYRKDFLIEPMKGKEWYY